jgi:hypothetical protein
MNHCQGFFRFAYQPLTHQPTRSFKALHLLLIGLLMGGIVAVSSLQAAVVTTDSSAYQPGSKVGISGMNYVAGERVRLVITYADGTPLPSGVVSTWEVTASLSGSIGGTDVGSNDGSGDTNLDGFLTNWWMLQNATPGASLRLTATGETSGYAASTTLLVANTNFHQLQNGTPANPEWANGAINANNSCYAESQSVPYRFFMLSMSAGTTHTFKLTFEATKSTLHSFDYLSQYNLTESGPIVTVGGECSSTSAAAPDDCSTPAAVAALRDPRLVTSYVSAPPADISDIIDPLFPIDGPGNLFAYNAINVQVGQYSFGGTATNRELNVIVSFQVVANGSVGFFWAGHLATGDPTGWGLGQGSGSISGAPFHMSAGEVDGSGGMPNLAVQNGVVCLPPDLTMTCGTGPYCSGGTFTCSVPAGATNYTWTVTGGTIGSGQGTNSITYQITAAVGNPVTVAIGACNGSGGCGSGCCSNNSTQFTAAECCQVAITCPTNKTIECNQSTNPSNTGTATFTATGSCPLPITISYTDTETAGTCPQKKTISRLWKAKDANGVVRAQCTQTINVVDSTAPVLAGCPANVTVECNSIPAPANPTATDNCDLTPTITYNQTTTGGSCPQRYTLTRTWTATDDCGNSSSCSQVIIVQDTQAPVVTCPAPISVQCIANVPTPNTALVTAVDNCDANPTITFVSDVSNGQLCPEKITRTYRATDHCGNSATCTQLITIQDTNPPVVTCPGPISVQCFADVPTPNTALVSAVDNCDASPTIVWLSDQVGTGNCPKTIIRTYKAIDDCGNIGTCTQTITVNDNTPPVITCPPNESIYCGESSDPSNTGYATATDNCTASGSIVITYIDTPNGGGFTRTWKATDECGNQSTCQQTISTPPDLTPPQITCPDDITVECFADVPAPSPVSVVVIDNCDPNPVVVFVDDERNGTSCPYTITREYKATDASGNWAICTQIITVDDTTPPVITCPPNTTIYCNESSDPSNTGYATATDNCTATGNIVITYSDSQNGGGITRTWKATDDCDNWSSCQQIISTSPDTTPPQITCPDPVTVECPADVPTPIPLLIVAVDDCDPSPVVIWVSDVSQGSCPTIITRTYKATDASGNWATCTQIITVDDQTLPQLVGCPSNVTVSCDNIPAPANVTATDNCPGVTVNYSQNETPGQCAQEKTITRTWTATDLCGNQVSCSQVITVEDNTPPVFTNCPGGMTVECIGDVPQPNPALCTATDNCDPNPTITFVSDVSNGQTCPEIITRTYKATDACGNEATCQQIITVDDTTPPQITCPAGITVSCLAEKPQPNPALCTVTDNCDPAPSVVFVSDVQNGTGCPFTITRKYSAMDHCGNIASCEQIITVHDQTPPVLVDCPQNVTVNCGNVPPVANVTATDNCNGNVSVVFGETTTPGNCAYNYTITRTWTATDACGNVASCQQTITVQDVTPPQIACPNGVTVECIANKPQPNPALVTATDNCDPNPVVVWVSDVVGQQRCPAQIIRTYRATDACGNQATCTQIITVEDRTAPSFTTFPADQNIFQCQPTQICLPVAATDNCQGPVVLSLMNGSKGAINAGQWCVTPTVTESYNVTIRAVDTCGNFVDRTFHVDYRLNSAPTFTNCPQDARIHWGETYTVDLNATDPDAGQTLTYSLCPGAPQGVTIDPTTGVLRFASTARDICDPEICVIVKDDCQATATCSFNVCVYNEPPTFDTTSSICPGDQVICYGYSFADSVHATDPDNGPYGPFYYKLSGPPELTVNVNTGKIEWLSPLPGNYVICVLATDSGKTCVPCSPSNADTCCFELRVISLDLVIEKKHDQVQGQFTDVSISFMRQGSNWPIAGYDLLIQYDNSALTFQKADEGKFFKDCVWEYFTYRFGQNGNCGPGACPTGVLRIVAMAETTGGNMAEHPDCYTNDGIPNPGPDSSTSKEMAVLRFLVSNDRTLECQFAPIRFVWYDCGDNSLSNVRGDTLFISNFVYDYAGEVGHPPVVQWHDITGLDNTWPTVTGALRAECDSIHFKSELIQCANFYNGGVDIVCADSIDAPGDINMNDIAYEIADAVMFTNYFISGLSAFVDCTGLTEAALDACREHQQGAIAASDANRDGIMLSVSDLVYVIRVVVGDAQPYGKGTPMAAVPVDYSIEDGVVTVSGGIDLGGAALMVRGEVKPQLLAPDMSMTYAFDGEMTRIVVTPPVEATSMHTFRGAFLGGITGEVVSLELATAAGAPVAAKNVPSRYELSQNYPNPFNPSTKINVALKDAGDYSLTIYNVQGQVVEVIRGSAAGPERLEISWNASGLASGVYLYRLDAGQFTQTRKMLLLK